MEESEIWKEIKNEIKTYSLSSLGLLSKLLFIRQHGLH